MKALSMPDLVTWEITEKCNMKCSHCSNYVNGSPISLSKEECKKIIDQIHLGKVFKVSVEGGEPFMREDIIELIQYMNTKNIYPKIATNGTLLNEDMVNRLGDCIIDSVQVSLDGSDSQKYSSLRKSTKMFAQAVDGIKNLVKNNIYTSITMVLTKETINDVMGLLNLAIELKVNAVRFIDFIPMGRGTVTQCPDAEELEKVYLTINEFKKKNKNLDIVIPTKITSLINKYSEKTILETINKECGLMCEAGTLIAHIRANGDVYPCVYFRDSSFSCGNLLNESFVKIWKESKVMNLFRSLGELHEECQKCGVKSHCMGGCRAYAYYKLGNIVEKDTRCWRNENNV